MGRWFQQLTGAWPILRTPKPANHRDDPKLTAWCADTAREFQLTELARKVRVTWNARMQTTAGRAWWPDRLIELNPKLREIGDDQLWRTLKHELAHLFAYERCGRRRIEPHGSEWQAACAELGIAGEQPFHNLPFERKRMRRNYAYTCPWCLTTIRRVRRISRTVACYTCCRKHSDGAFDSRFQLIERKVG